MGRTGTIRSGLLVVVSGMALLSAGRAGAAPALPTGGGVAAGSASISSSGSSMTVTQATPKAIIDWASFSIGQGGSVAFNNGSGATLNRVTGTSGSSIDGLLSGTGSIYLINPNGVIVGKSGEVKVGGSFVASTLDIPNSGFLSGGNLTFSGPSTAAVVNEGKVGSLGGDVVLIASTVSNGGSLSAANGTVGLLAGQSVLLRDQVLDGGKFSVLVGGAGTSATNSGLIEAANAELRANGGNVYALAGNTAGVIKSTGVSQGDGHVWLVADGGSLDVAGTITARGPNGSGGTIETSGTEVKIAQSSIGAGAGGTWLIDPYDLTIDTAAAGSISGALNSGTNVTEQTTASSASGDGIPNPSGKGDIFVQAPISWSTGAQLTLDAYRNITVTSPITVSGAGKVALHTGTGGALDFGLSLPGFAGRIDFTGAEGSGQSLAINGLGYNLIYTITELAALNGSTGRYAAAASLTPSATYSDAVIKTFGGKLEGLGHTVDGLVIDSNQSGVGLIGTLQEGGLVANIGVVGGSITGYRSVGPLVGSDQGTVTRSYATSQVVVVPGPSGDGGLAGGLVGSTSGTPEGTHRGLVTWSFAAGSVSARHGTVGQELGGLVGFSQGQISDSYATGEVDGGGVDLDEASALTHVGGIGGLAGYSSGTLARSYATGSVRGVRHVGGLVGELGSTIFYDFATGSVTGNASQDAGGLIGDISGNASIGYSYATGFVGPSRYRGGLVGVNAGSQGDWTADYWNTDTAGAADAVGRTNSCTSCDVTGLTTTELKGSLPSGFSSSIWGQIPGVSYPYQLDIFPTTPQVISGTVTGQGVQPGYRVSAIVNGVTNIGSAYAGADVSYYFLEPSGTLPQDSTLIVYIDHEARRGAAAVEDIGAGGSITGLYFTSDAGAISTRDTTFSAAIADLAKGLGPATTAAGDDIVFGLSGSSLTLIPQATTLDIFPGGSGIDFDQDLDLGPSRTLGMVSYNGPITQSAGTITVGKIGGSSNGGLALTSAGNQIGKVLGWSDGAGSISITDSIGLLAAGSIDASDAVNLVATGGDLVIGGSVTSGAGGVTLQSSGTVTELDADGVVSTTGTLDVTGVGGVVMDSANVAPVLVLHNTGGGTVRYAALGSISVSSASNAGGAPITLSTALDSGNAGMITLTGVVSGGSVKLDSADAITETVNGSIRAPLLQGSAAGAVTLNGENLIGKLYNFTSTGGDLSLRDGQTLTVAGLVDGTGRTVGLTTTAGDIIVNGTIKASTLNLTSQAGALREALNSGAIIADTLNASADTGIRLTGGANQITTVGTDHTAHGPNHIQQ